MLDQLIKQAKLTTQSTEYNNQTAKDKFYFSYAWKKKRQKILRFYNFECQLCKSNGKVTLAEHTKIIVHHIKPLEYFPELKFEDDNLIALCHDCHNKVHETFGTKWDDEWW
ncbi:HNH endonuclease [Jeotgalibaca porci]|uniref:HNH endonuclease n=1 Tax=Jeotgalibaca porci TaxID=1868793 RepID=UPI00359F1CDF